MYIYQQKSNSHEKGNSRQPIPAPYTPHTHPQTIIQRAYISPNSLTHADVIQLQKTIGNRAVIQLFKNVGIIQTKTNTKTVQEKESNSGLPDNLKKGLEGMSGFELSDVRVHHNSNKPLGIGARAYTQGNDIYVAPGQEEYLPHEGWHVVQQRQGRVQATTEAAGLLMNNDTGLEKEADEMGRKAYTFSNGLQGKLIDSSPIQATGVGVIQCGCWDWLAKLFVPKFANDGVNYAQLPTVEAGEYFTLNAKTSLFHGTRWNGRDAKWWEQDFPNKEGEDGGISFTLDPESTPKVKNAQIIIRYELKKNAHILNCQNKGQFQENVQKGIICYTRREAEVAFNLGVLKEYLEYKGYATQKQPSKQKVVLNEV